MASDTLRRALLGPAGPVAVTRIEMEIVGGKCRWNLWSHARRIYSAVAAPDQMGPMLEATELLLQANGVR